MENQSCEGWRRKKTKASPTDRDVGGEGGENHDGEENRMRSAGSTRGRRDRTVRGLARVWNSLFHTQGSAWVGSGME